MRTLTPPREKRPTAPWRHLPLRPADRAALAVWMGSRAAMVVIAAMVPWFIRDGDSGEPFLERWTQWDVDLLIEIARYGYDGDPAEEPDPGLPAFFPGFPLLLRATYTVIPDWRVAALLISLVSGAVAAVALARLGDREGPAGSGPLAVLALVLSPVAVFLFAGYTETLFLAFAIPAWLLARQGRWPAAALCAAAAGLVRITGLFLAVALVVEFLLQWRRGAAGRDTDRAAGGSGAGATGGRPGPRTRWGQAPWLLAPFGSIAAYVAYQWWRTGTPAAWLAAQERGWGRSLVWPWEAFQTTLNEAVNVQGPFTGAFRAELVAAALGVAVTGWLLYRRRWPEGVYVGLQMAALLSSAFYLSIGRAALLWWPLWLAIGALGVRWRRRYAVIVAAMAPLMVWYVAKFTTGAWAG